MNRYPLWKNATVIIALVLGLLYTLPNFFGEAPAVQVASVKATTKVDPALLATIQSALKAAAINPHSVVLDATSVRVRLNDSDTQLKTRDLLDKLLNPDATNGRYSVALNLVSNTPSWLASLHAAPMYLGLDLRGGVHFLLQVDMEVALTKRLDSMGADLRALMREKSLRHAGVGRDGKALVIRFRDLETRDKARAVISQSQPDLTLIDGQDSTEFKLSATLKPLAERSIQEFAIKQNITTLHKRINELGVAEPVIQQQGADRIVVQLPGVQDVARARDLIGRTASLEVRMVEQEATLGTAPLGTEMVPETKRDGSVSKVAVKKLVVLTGERFADAQSTFDNEHRPAVAITLDAAGGRIMRDLTRENLHKLMAILLIEKGHPEAISVATIQGEFGNHFQITGSFTPEETNTLAILIRSGAIAAPMSFIEERVIGPSLGADNITKGMNSTMWGFMAIAAFMMSYYLLFGFISVVALSANLVLLVALLSLLQATLTLPGIAAVALTLGMAIDSNVLINERIREELRGGTTPQAAITAGYERAWATILDSNVTTLIVGIALLIFGSGPVRGFAVVHCLGILTSMFSSVVISRSLVNWFYGSRKKLESVSIGQIWKPGIK
ncbi:MAG: protein translocase subunit SecD [Rhodocyclaceae bacterium]|nr:protein translocase subunit SecD [Rhodocyclaceae bacterium]MBP6108544.1 protein translocase subunit SecD [Rhodocyclaceae bacterium]MBP6278661.1 protein translocase subunit SecD [Rhodocyclaceae bacterium]